MKLTATEGSDFEAAPSGIWPARLIWLIDLGIQDTPFGTKPQLFMNFELVANGTHHTIGKFYTASLNEKATLAKDLGSWRNKTIKPGEELDLSKLLGLFCQLQVLENDKGRQSIKAILPKSAMFESLEPLLTEKDYNQLPEFFQQAIDKQLTQAEPPKRKPGGMSDLALEKVLDDEVPF